MKRTFDCQPHIVGRMDNFGNEQVMREPMFFSSNAKHVLETGGPVSQNFIESLPFDWQSRLDEVIIDTRWHVLRLGMFPAIPGWHHDDVPRAGRNGQPNYLNPEYHSKHIAAIIGDASRTRFIHGRITVPEVREEDIVYEKWNAAIERLLYTNRATVRSIDTRDLNFFTADDFHEGTQATHNGVRFFARASIDTKRQFFNEHRVQVQTYIAKPPQNNSVFEGLTPLPTELSSMACFDTETIRHERMLTGNVSFAKNEGGPITKAFIEALPTAWREDPSVMVDMTVYMLMPGWNPVLPGDEIYETTLRPIDPDAPSDMAGQETIHCTIGNSAPLRHLAARYVDEFERPLRVGYGDIDVELMEDASKKGALLTTLPFQRLCYSQGGILLAAPSTQASWQAVMRATRVNDPVKIENRIRHQAQINMRRGQLYSGW